MRRSITPRYRLHIQERELSTGRSHSFTVSHKGVATVKAAEAYARTYEASTQPGGYNHRHLGIRLVTEVQIVRQVDGVVLTTWRPPLFRAV
jgi:hypothetical protein